MPFTDLIAVHDGDSVTLYVARNVTHQNRIVRAYGQRVATELGAVGRHFRDNPFLEINMAEHDDVTVTALGDV